MVRPGSRYHGDQAVHPGMLDFAVNVRHDQPPAWLRQRLAARLADLAGYPSAADHDAAVRAVAGRHGVPDDHVLLLAGGSEGFALLPALKPSRAALIAPSFTEPEAALSAAGVPIDPVVLPPPFLLAAAVVPDNADLVVLGNPTNPTGVLHPREAVLALRSADRIVVVDEAFADAAPDEYESLAGLALPDVLVLRSLTKTWSLAGLRVGYALGAPEVLARLAAPRPHWPLGTLQLEAISACCTPVAVAEARADAQRLAALRAAMAAALAGLGLEVVHGSAPFVLFAVPDAPLMRKQLAAKGIAVRRCDTFVGLGEGYLRAAVRPEWPSLVSAVEEALR
jgi:histidinol-phosphate aminotransferase